MRGVRSSVTVVLATCAVASANPGSEAPKRLLDAPLLQIHSHSIASFGGGGAAVRVTWTAVPGAVRYHTMWAGPTDKPIDAWSTSLGFHHDSVPAGHYTLTVAAMDAAGTEGAPTPPLAIDVVEVSAVPPGKVSAEAPTRGAYAVGTQFSALGATCSLGGMSSAEVVKTDPTKVRATRAGVAELTCADGKLKTPIVIAPVMVAAKEEPLPRGETTTVHVIVASEGAVGELLTVQGIGGAKAGPPQKTPFGIDVPLAIAPDAEAAAIAVSAGGLELGRTGFDLYDKPAPPAPPPPPGSAAGAFDLAMAAGTFLPTASGNDGSATAIGHPTAARDVVGAGVLFGPRFGLYLVPRVGIEAQAAIITFPVNNDRAAAFSARGQVAIRALESKWVGARLVAGAGAIQVLQDVGTVTQSTSGEVHYGVGLTLTTTPGVSLRADVLDVMTTSRDRGYAHNLELELAVVARFGRRDRW